MPGVKLELMMIIQELHVYWKSVDDPESFEFKLRAGSRVWPAASPKDVFTQHENDDF